MNKKIFLLSLATAFSALSQNASATTESTPAPTEGVKQTGAEKLLLPYVADEKVILTRENGDLFKFTIQRNEDGQLLAQHYSHTSHASHASHASHSSHYSGR